MRLDTVGALELGSSNSMCVRLLQEVCLDFPPREKSRFDGRLLPVTSAAADSFANFRIDPAMKKILVVDDQPTIRRLVEISLRSGDRQILEAESGERAIEVAHDQKPDLIIMDLMMPGGMDGFEAVEILKADPATRDCPVLVLTAKDQKAERLKAFEIGAGDYLAKPFKLDVLVKKVENLLN